jgi:hypothetical protein
MEIFTPAERRALDQVRAMNVGTGLSGGFAVPFQLDPTVLPSDVGTSMDPGACVGRK